MLATVRSIWRHLIDLLLFRHEHLKQHYTTYTVTRINTHLDQLATQGQLMRGQFRTRQWMGFRVVRRLCEAWIQKARDEVRSLLLLVYTKVYVLTYRAL